MPATKHPMRSWFEAPTLIGERYNNDLIDESRAYLQKVKTQTGEWNGILICPQCRLAGYRRVLGTRTLLHGHLLDHRILRALGRESDLYAHPKCTLLKLHQDRIDAHA